MNLRNLFTITLLAAIAVNLFAQPALITMDLNGSWEFREVGKGEWHPAKVPGTNFADLLENHMIPDPYSGTNEMDVQWIEERDWEYRKRFRIEREFLAHDRIILEFEGLDTYAEVYLNNHHLILGDNQHLAYETDIKPWLKAGSNELLVHFQSPVNRDLPRLQQLGNYTLPSILEIVGPGIERSDDERTAPFTRKAQCQFSWDWGPRTVTSGIWRPVTIKAWAEGRIRSVFYRLDLLLPDRAEYTIHAGLEINRKGKYRIEIVNESDGIIMAEKELELEPCTGEILIPLQFLNPRLWWPNGSGDPHLYRLQMRLTKDGHILHEKRTSLGIRTILVERKPDYVRDLFRFSLGGPEKVDQVDHLGSSFSFIVNGVPVYMKGANYVPSDALLRRTPERFDSLLNMALFANYNMLRMWGGGIYEDDVFYQKCSEKGLLVWHDFMFACNMYPGDSAFLASVRKEADYQVKRLRNHPCIALWSGNNEIQRGWNKWGFQNKYNIHGEDSVRVENDYRKIFHDILPGSVAKYDPDKFYWSSSPQADVNETSTFYKGDMHQFWMFGGEPYEIAEEVVSRFTSETGMQSLPDPRTVHHFTPPADLYLFSEVLQSHQKRWYGDGTNGYDKINIQLERYYPEPTCLEDYVYLSQLSQSKFMKMNIEAHRRKKPYNMGFVYWQFNDTWPGPSWSTVDYFLRPKAGHYAVRDLYAPLLVSVKQEDQQLQVYLCNDELRNKEIILDIRLLDFDGALLMQQERRIVTRASRTEVVATLDPGWIPSDLKDRAVLHVRLLGGLEENELLASTFQYFVHEKELALKDPGLTITKIADEPPRYSVSSTSLAKGVFLECDDQRAVFTDNFFDLLPGKPHEVEFLHEPEKKVPAEKIRLRSLYELIKD